jgi:hypothetical protein
MPMDKLVKVLLLDHFGQSGNRFIVITKDSRDYLLYGNFEISINFNFKICIHY